MLDTRLAYLLDPDHADAQPAAPQYDADKRADERVLTAAGSASASLSTCCVSAGCAPSR